LLAHGCNNSPADIFHQIIKVVGASAKWRDRVKGIFTHVSVSEDRIIRLPSMIFYLSINLYFVIFEIYFPILHMEVIFRKIGIFDLLLEFLRHFIQSPSKICQPFLMLSPFGATN